MEDLDWKVGFKGKEGKGWQSLMIRGRDEEIRGEGVGVLRQASDKVYSTVIFSPVNKCHIQRKNSEPETRAEPSTTNFQIF